MTPEERTQMMNEGRCFRCRKLGHLSKNCLGKGKKPEPEKPVPRKRTGEETATYIRMMVATMNNDEKKKLQEELGPDF